MAANARSHDLAFQSAEAALRYVETNLGAIGPQIPVPADTASGTVTGPGLRAINTCLPNGNTYWNGSGEFDCNGNLQAFVWSAANAIQLTSNLTTLNQVEQYPWYIVERYPDSGVYQQYRVTTIGYGSDANTMVILQAMFHI
jgi:Tfp pilus assembly protein PilX